MNNVLVRAVAAAALALAFVVACNGLLYAGSTAGEGFSAAVLVVLAVLLQHVVLGSEHARRLFPPIWFRRAQLSGLGLLIVLMVAPLGLGGAMLEAATIDLGPLTLKSALLFDIAVFLLVAGSMLTAFTWDPSEPPRAGDA